LRALPVELALDPCTGVSPEVVSRILTVELGVTVTTVSPGDSSDSRQRSEVTSISLSCDEGTIRMTVRDPVSGKTLDRHVDLRGERTSARPRLLGLSAAELVAASWVELEAAPPPPAPIVEATAPPPARAVAADAATSMLKRQKPVPWDLEALAVARRFSEVDLTSWGGGIGGSWAYEGWLALGADLLAEAGSSTVVHDQVPVGTASMRTGSIGLSARLRRSWLAWALEAGVGARLAATSVKAMADDAQSGLWQEHAFTRMWWGPTAGVRVAWKPSRAVLLVGAVEGGTVMQPMTGLVAKTPDVLITGPWIALSFGVGIGAEGPDSAM
jgi:hypothetical protein